MNNDELYPNPEDEVFDPMRKDLDGGGHNINNLNALDLVKDGAINGVVTINGLPYPPNYLPLPTTRNQEFLFPAAVSIAGDGTLYKLFTIYDNTSSGPVNSQLAPLFGNKMDGLNLVILTIYTYVQTNESISNFQGKVGFSLFVNGYASVPNQRSEYLIPRELNSSPAQNITLTFPILCPVPSPLKLELYAYGGYGYTYYFNLNKYHSGDSQPTVCRALGLR